MALARLSLPTNPPSMAWIALYSLIFANLPDVDYLFGFIVGRPNAFHRDWTHSLVFALGIAVLFMWIRFLKSSTVEIRSSLLVFGLISSHLVVDYFALDMSDPVGIPLFWPFSSEHYIAPIILFRDVHKGVTNAAFFRVLFSSHNLITLLSELMIFGPFVAISYWILNRKTQRFNAESK